MCGDYLVSASVIDSRGRTVGTYRQTIYVPENLKLLDNDLVATLERSYYTTEERMTLMVTSRLNVPLVLRVRAGDFKRSEPRL